MDAPITRAEYEEFKLRLEEENERQNKRLTILEEDVREMGALTTSVERLAVSMENMVKEQEKQGARLETLEGRDGENWREVVKYILLTVLGAAIGFLLTRMGW